MRKHYKTFKYIILFLVADWFYFQNNVIPGFGNMNFRIGDFFFVYFFILYFKYIFDKNVKKTLINYLYFFFLISALAPLYLGAQNTQLSYAFRDFQVVSFSITFFVGLFVIHDSSEIKKFLNFFIIAFILRELFLLFTLGPEIGYLNRIIALADTSQTSYIQNLAIYFFLYKYFTIKKTLYKTISICLVIYLSLALFAEGKMGGILTLSIGLLVILKYTLSKKNYWKFAFILILFALILVNVSGHEFMQYTFDRISMIGGNLGSDPTSQWRLLAWAQGIDVFKSHIIFGGGYSWPVGWLSIPMKNGPEWVWGTTLHNEYLHILSSGGIINFCVFLLFIVYVLQYFVRKIKLINNYNDKIFSSILFASFVSFLITGFTNPAWTFFVSMVGWAFGSFGYRYIELILNEGSDS